MAETAPDTVIMNALKTILPGYPTPNTNLSAYGGTIAVQNEYAISTGTFPALHLEVGEQKHEIAGGPNVYDATMKVIATYYDRWDSQTSTVDAVWANIAADLRTMKINVQENNSLAIGGTALAISIPIIELSGYRGELDQRTCPGMILAKRTMTLTVRVLPYDA